MRDHLVVAPHAFMGPHLDVESALDRTGPRTTDTSMLPLHRFWFLISTFIAPPWFPAPYVPQAVALPLMSSWQRRPARRTPGQQPRECPELRRPALRTRGIAAARVTHVLAVVTEHRATEWRPRARRSAFLALGIAGEPHEVFSIAVHHASCSVFSRIAPPTTPRDWTHTARSAVSAAAPWRPAPCSCRSPRQPPAACAACGRTACATARLVAGTSRPAT